MVKKEDKDLVRQAWRTHKNGSEYIIKKDHNFDF